MGARPHPPSNRDAGASPPLGHGACPRPRRPIAVPLEGALRRGGGLQRTASVAAHPRPTAPFHKLSTTGGGGGGSFKVMGPNLLPGLWPITNFLRRFQRPFVCEWSVGRPARCSDVVRQEWGTTARLRPGPRTPHTQDERWMGQGRGRAGTWGGAWGRAPFKRGGGGGLAPPPTVGQGEGTGKWGGAQVGLLLRESNGRFSLMECPCLRHFQRFRPMLCGPHNNVPCGKPDVETVRHVHRPRGCPMLWCWTVSEGPDPRGVGGCPRAVLRPERLRLRGFKRGGGGGGSPPPPKFLIFVSHTYAFLYHVLDVSYQLL